MAAANPSPRRRDEPAAQGGEPPRRGTSHGVALALAIGVTLLLLFSRWGCVAWMAWMNDGERQPVVAPEPAVNAAADDSSESREPIAFPDPVPATAERVEAPVLGEPAKSHRESRARVEVVEIVDATSGATAPLAGAEVRVSLEVGEVSHSLARLVTDRAGIVECDFSDALARLPEVGRGLASIVATASAPLHGTRGDSRQLPRDGSVVTLRLELPRGAAVRGRVVDGKRAPVSGARVSLFVVEGDVFQEGERTAGDGRFELPIVHAARRLVRACAAGVGCATSPALDLEPTIDVELGDLVLQGRGTVGGRVADARGDPVAEVVVEARRSDFAGLGGLDDPVFVQPEGLPGGRGVSRSDGRFKIAGLAPGRYRLSTPDEPSTEARRHSLHELGDDAAVLVVSRHRLRVIVQDEAGAPIAGASLFVHYGHGGDALSATTDAHGSFIVYGQPGLRAVVGASAPDCLPAEGETTYGALHEDAELVLTLRPIGATTSALALTIVDESGAVVTPATITLRGALGSPFEGWSELPLPAGGCLARLPTGRFQVEGVAGAPLAKGFPRSSFFFPATAEVELRAHATTELSLRLRAGGRLRFRVRVRAGAATDWLSKARLDLMPRSPTRPSLSVAYCLDDDGTVHLRRADFTPEVTFLSAPLLEPGNHHCQFTVPGSIPTFVPFTIRAGQITDVDLWLEPE